MLRIDPTACRIETSALARLALPILGAQLAQAAMSTVDVMMSGHSSATDLAAVSVGASLWVPLMLFMTGTLMGLTPIVAQHMGAQQQGAIRPSVHQALWVALVLGVAACVLIWLTAEPIFIHMSVPEAVATSSTRYLHAVAFGMPAVALYQALRAFSDGVNHTRPALWISLVGLAVNIPFNYLLIFGGEGIVSLTGVSFPLLDALPALGATGCGMATAIAMWVMCGCMAFYTCRARVYAPVQLWKGFSRPDLRLTMELLRVGLPIGVAIFTEVTLFALIALFVASFGETVVAAHQVALNFTSLLFMLPLSLGMALTVRVGNTLGQGDSKRARFIAWNGVGMALVAALLIDIILIVAAHLIVALYSSNMAVRSLAANLILLAAIYQISDALQVSMAGALRGYKDTRIIMLITLASYWIVGMGGGHLLGGGMPEIFSGWGVYGYWLGLIAGLSVASVLLGLRLYRTSDRHCRPTPAKA